MTLRGYYPLSGHDTVLELRNCDRQIEVIGRVPMSYRGSKAGTYVVAAVDATKRIYMMADVRCDGPGVPPGPPGDDIEIQWVLDALPAAGGKIILSEGTFTIFNQIARAINNVTIEGCGRATTINFNGAQAVISDGGQAGWLLTNLNTDAGGVDITGANSVARYWQNGVYVEAGIGADARGTGTIPNGANSVNVAHGLGIASLVAVVTPQTDPGSGGIWVSAIGAANITVNRNGTTGALTFYWKAEVV